MAAFSLRSGNTGNISPSTCLAIFALQVENLCCTYYHVVTNLSRNKIQCCKLRQHVAQSRLEFYFLQQILGLLLVLPLKLQLVSQQIQIQHKFDPTTPNMSQHVATRWPNARNMLRPTMLRYVALACCDRLAGA